MNNHKWKCTSPGMYDDTYTCLKCGDTHIVSADSPDSTLPITGCGIADELPEGFESVRVPQGITIHDIGLDAGSLQTIQKRDEYFYRAGMKAQAENALTQLTQPTKPHGVWETNSPNLINR